jgi:diguanylate cyclase (GGDEF)-like protein/putative nucleotidyltransferase with HDIG domain
MPLRTKFQICLTIVLAAAATATAAHVSHGNWPQFWLFLAAVLLSSGFKVALPRGDGSMSLNFPFILFAIICLSPLQVLLLAAMSVAVQCRVRVKKIFTAVQIVFNIANTMLASAAAYVTYLALVKHRVEIAPALAIASISYFFWSTCSVASILASSNGEKTLKLWKSEFPWYLPFYLVGAVLAATAHWISLRFGWATALLLIPMVYTVYRSYTAQIERLKERQQHLEETQALHLRTIEGLAMAIEAKDQNTHDHLFRVRTYVEEVGRAMSLGSMEIQALHTAAFLHDIGKLAVPEHIINKPGKLTPEEFEKMKIHPIVGADILERVRFPYPVVPIVRSHHEWWNGAGYPDGLEGEAIPIGARILSVVDCFDALVSDRPYRKGLPMDEALKIVKNMAGIQFDPKVVKVLESLHLDLERKGEELQLRGFSALNTDLEVWRGLAPGAGFEEEMESTLAMRPAVAAESAHKEAQKPLVSLDLIAAASHEAQTLFELSQSLGNSLRLNETISVMASRLRRLIPYDTCALYLKQGDLLVAQLVEGESVKSFNSEPITEGQGISGWVAQSGKPILNGNAAVEPNYECKFGLSGGLRSALSVPLLDLQQQVFAVLTLYSITEDGFQRDHLRILQAMEGKLSLSLQNALHFQRAECDAETDFFTTLPNARGLFMNLQKELQHCIEHEQNMAVVVCDLNAFKQVNDRCGHLNGNALLAAVADAFRACCRPGDRVARMGGDEFVFLLHGVTTETAPEWLRKISDAVVASCRRCTGVTVKVTASLGAAFYPQDGINAEDLLAVADRRMYIDKQAYHQRETIVEQMVLMEAVAI